MIAVASEFDLVDDACPPQAKSEWYDAGKRAVDLAFSLLLLIPGLPLIFASILLVKLTSRGPAIYSQIRVGRGGRQFVIYKIRTMRNNCEKLTGPRWADLNRDPRLTFTGAFLRRTHLDELPQLFNVFRGDMTLVGPRPERPEFVSQLALAIPHYQDRLNTRPGVTGLAQVLLPPDTDVNSVRTKLTYDLFYLQKSGYWLDLKIIACTILKVLCVPREITRKVLRVPDHKEIEGAYEALASTSVRPRDAIEMQPAF